MKYVFTVAIWVFGYLSYGQVLNVSEMDKVGGTLYDDKIEIDGKLYTGVIYALYENGSPKFHKQIRNGLTDGLWQEWHETGHLKYYAFWSEGKGHGIWRYYHENGQLRSEGIYENDIPTGIHLEFNEEGEEVAREYYVEGKQIK